MGYIDREGTFRGRIVASGVSLTKNEFPQFVATLVADQIYDEDESKWVGWSDVQENEITAYLCLFGGKGETVTCKQVKLVTGWDGASFGDLNDGNYVDTKVQFRVETHSYNNTDRLQVAWIDEYEAVPGQSVKKLDPDKVKGLDAKFGLTGKRQAPAKAPATAPVTTTTAVTVKGVKPTAPKGPVKNKGAVKVTSAELAAPAETVPVATVPFDTGQPPVACSRTMEEAWTNCVERRKDTTTDEQLATAWTKVVKDVAKGRTREQLTPEEWYQVEETVIKAIDGIPF